MDNTSVLIALILSLIPILYYLLKPPYIPSIPTATPHIPIIGNSATFRLDPIKFLRDQRARHGDIFLVNLAVIRIVFFLGPEGTNAVFKGTDRSGVGFYAALSFLLGAIIDKGLSMEGWEDTSHKILLKILPSPEYLESWMELIRPIAKERFNMWAESGQPVSLFRGVSDLVMRLLLYVFAGPKFAEKWCSKEGRLLEAVEERMTLLISEEVRQRLENPKQYEKNMDYLQAVLNLEGGKYLPIYGLHILGVINGGHTNQTSTFVWSLIHALRSPLLESLRQQKTNDLLEATFRETGRLYTNLMILRRVTIPQVILGKHVPKGTFIACSPLVTARDPNLFDEPDKYRPDRWLTPTGEVDDAKLKTVTRSGTSVQFGKGQHACLGEKLGRAMVMLFWSIVLGNDEEPGFDVEIVSGVREGVGLDNVGVEGAWAEENLGTPFVKGDPVMVRFSKRSK